jgi:branched-chain amino acid transport system permease protein
MSLDLLVGFAGLDSLGHAAFFGIGAYTGALLLAAGPDNALWLLGAAAAVGALAGMVLGAVALRAPGAYFLIITLALGYLPAALASRWRSLSGGDDGLVVPGRPTLAGLSLESSTRYFFFVAVIFLICVLALRAIGCSSFGYSLRGIKESSSRMEALGYRVWPYQFAAFVIAATFAAAAGALNAFYNTFVSPTDLSLENSVAALVAVILGGAGTLIGPAIGAAAILLLRHLVGAATQHWATVLGLFYIAVVILAPAGLAFGIARVLSGRRVASP